MTMQQITSQAYVLGITKEKILSDIYKSIYNRVINYVSDTHSPARSKWWYPSWPDIDIENKDSYPIGIIYSPELENWRNKTQTKTDIDVIFTIEVNTTSSSELDDLSSQVVNAIETSTDVYRRLNLNFLVLDGTDTDSLMRDRIKMHKKTLDFSATFTFNKSYA